ncbi:MAG: succinyldiaminopimelate transaminase [Nitrospirota bacterium]|nr:succinyldiaminopimelate transaminase [Nitrospirota bacterium]
MNPRLSQLPAYPFERLRALLKGITPLAGLSPISMSVGEPRHPSPKVFLDALRAAEEEFSNYPTTQGGVELRGAIAAWLTRRFHLPTVDPETQVVPCSGTREALFSVAQALTGVPGKDLVLLPNPFYQIYEGAALWAGATPHYVPATEASGLLPDFAGLPEAILDRAALVYLCTPGNPTGRVMDREYLQQMIRLAHRHGFVLVSDECYSEIYPDENSPPCGLLEAAAAMGHGDYRGCLAMHSLSKRSNLPGARSGFVAGDATILAAYLRLRTYFGCTTPPPIQRAAAAAWGDEAHVRANRDEYRKKFARVLEELAPVLPVTAPDAGFYLWTRVPGGGEAFAQRVFERCNITVLPGSYLSRLVDGVHPGAEYVRMALVDSVEQCAEAARRIRSVV